MAKKKFGTTRTLPSGMIQARYRLKTGEQITAGTYDSVEVARDALDEIEVDIRRGEHWDGRKGKTRFTDFMSIYMEHRVKTVTAGEYSNNRSYLKVHLLPAFGHLKMRDLDEEIIDRWWDGQAPTETRRNVYMFLWRSMYFAVKWKYIRSSPCQVDKPGKYVGTPRPTWSVLDFRKVMEQVPESFHAPLEVLFAGHLRLGELIALNVDDYDRKTGKIAISKQLTTLGHTTDTKTGQHKEIKLLSNGIAALKSLPPAIGTGPLFHGPRGGRLPRITLRKVWNRAVIDAGLSNFHLHDLRHISLSVLAASGTPMKDIQTRGGHASATSAFRYQHTDADRDAAVVATTDALLASLSFITKTAPFGD